MWQIKQDSARAKQPRAGAKQQIGYEAEAQACAWLQSKGMKLVVKNYRVPSGEVDIIGLVGDMLVFFEVRFRSPSDFASAAESVTRRKQNRIVMAAQSYLQQHPKWAHKAARFDVITASGTSGEGNMNFDWIENAFQPQAAF